MMATNFNPKAHLTDLKGKKYLEVTWRIAWFRSVHPSGRIETEVVSVTPILMKALVYDADMHLLATGHGSANEKPGSVWAGRGPEKAETAAIGRALGAAGFGTQFSGDEFNDSDHLSDSPQERRHPQIEAITPPDWAMVQRETAELFDDVFKQKAVVERGKKEGWLHDRQTTALAIQSIKDNRAVKEAHWTSDAEALEKFVQWSLGWVEHKKDVFTALNQSVDYDMKKNEDYRGTKLEAMAAVVAYFSSYKKPQIQASVGKATDISEDRKPQVITMAIQLVDRKPHLAVQPEPVQP